MTFVGPAAGDLSLLQHGPDRRTGAGDLPAHGRPRRDREGALERTAVAAEWSGALGRGLKPLPHQPCPSYVALVHSSFDLRMVRRTGPSVPRQLARLWRHGTYVNPILDEDFPDPAIIHARTAFITPMGPRPCAKAVWINIQVARSTDLVLGNSSAMRSRKSPTGRGTRRTSGPRSSIHDGARYLMYYSATPDVCRVHERGHAWRLPPPLARWARSSTWECRCCSAGV